jgi:hypothetical protein
VVNENATVRVALLVASPGRGELGLNHDHLSLPASLDVFCTGDSSYSITDRSP